MAHKGNNDKYMFSVSNKKRVCCYDSSLVLKGIENENSLEAGNSKGTVMDLVLPIATLMLVTALTGGVTLARLQYAFSSMKRTVSALGKRSLFLFSDSSAMSFIFSKSARIFSSLYQLPHISNHHIPEPFVS